VCLWYGWFFGCIIVIVGVRGLCGIGVVDVSVFGG